MELSLLLRDIGLKSKFVNSDWSETDDFYSQFYRDEKYLFNHNNFLRSSPISWDSLWACFAAV
jgi:hypothetical protein